jgi:hypothetical protein
MLRRGGNPTGQPAASLIERTLPNAGKFEIALLAAALGLKNPITLDRIVKRGLIHPSRESRRPLFPVAEIQRYLAATQ